MYAYLVRFTTYLVLYVPAPYGAPGILYGCLEDYPFVLRATSVLVRGIHTGVLVDITLF